jgi:hypothetical protein
MKNVMFIVRTPQKTNALCVLGWLVFKLITYVYAPLLNFLRRSETIRRPVVKWDGGGALKVSEGWWAKVSIRPGLLAASASNR